jgi:hypothetical protein
MENQNIQWATWDEQPQENNEQPQVNWGEQPQQQENIPTWGEQPQPDNNQPQEVNWDDNNTTDENSWATSDDDQTPSNPNITPFNEDPVLLQNHSFLGSYNRLEISNILFQCNYDLSQAIKDLENADLKQLDDDGRYDFTPKANTELGNIIKTLVEVGQTYGGKVKDCFIYKTSPKESILNVFKGKPLKSFVFFLQADYDSGDIILDLSSIGGPAAKLIDSSPNILSLLPGWVPFRISKNNSSKELIAIVGTYN